VVTKLGIGTATSGLMEARTAFALATAMMFVSVPKQLYLGIGCYIHVNRNMVVAQALENGCSHLLFVDSDIMFNHDAIARLCAANVDIVGARYNKRVLPTQPTVKEDIATLSEVFFVPSGFLLVNTDVYRKIGSPYFYIDERSDCDDLYFCNKARDAGYKIYCDPTIEIGHLGTAIF
jgi:GT2 family glycosyltransferase